MSRWIEYLEGEKRIRESISNMDECKHMCNEVCCNEYSDQCGELVDPHYCKHCPKFEKEDGIITHV